MSRLITWIRRLWEAPAPITALLCVCGHTPGGHSYAGECIVCDCVDLDTKTGLRPAPDRSQPRRHGPVHGQREVLALGATAPPGWVVVGQYPSGHVVIEFRGFGWLG